MEDCPSPQVVQDKQLLTKNASSRKFEILGRGEFFEDETHVKLNRVGGTLGYCVGGQDGVPVLCADFFIFLTPTSFSLSPCLSSLSLRLDLSPFHSVACLCCEESEVQNM